MVGIVSRPPREWQIVFQKVDILAARRRAKRQQFRFAVRSKDFLPVAHRDRFGQRILDDGFVMD